MLLTLRAFVTAAAMLAATPVFAQLVMTPDEMTIVQQSLDRGQLIYNFDQAAWHGTDDMIATLEKIGKKDLIREQLGGWVVDGTANDPEILFFDKGIPEPHAIYHVRLTDGGRRVVSSHLFSPSEDIRISPARNAMIAALGIARVALLGSPAAPCAEQPFNTIVLPAKTPDAPTTVYFLTPQTDLGNVPAGGHYRVDVSADGKAGPVHEFTKSCLSMPTAQAKDHPKALVLTHLLDPVPTEIHVFTMFAASLPLYVSTTQNERLWAVEAVKGQARIRLVDTSRKN